MSELSDRTSPEMRGIIRTHPVSSPALSAPTLERCHATLRPVRGMLPGPGGSDTCLTGSSLGDETGQPVFNSAPLPVQKQHLLELSCKDGTRMSYFTEDINQPYCSLGCFQLLNALKFAIYESNLFVKFSHLTFWLFWTHVRLSDRSWCSLMEMRTVPCSSVFLLSAPWHSRTTWPPPTSARTSPALFQ